MNQMNMENGLEPKMEINKFSWFNIIKCKFKGHIVEYAGSCPFTGLRYNYCTKCGAMIPIDIID